MQSILHENQSPIQEIWKRRWGKKKVKETQIRQMSKRQVPEGNKKEAQENNLWRTTLLRRQVSLKSHRQTASWAKDF